MTKRQFSRAEIEYLRTLPSIDAVTDSRITYAREFQIDCMRRYLQGEKPTAIFISAGLSPSVIGHKRIERNIARWKRDEDIMRKAAEEPEPHDTAVDNHNAMSEVPLGKIQSLVCQVMVLSDRVDKLERLVEGCARGIKSEKSFQIYWFFPAVRAHLSDTLNAYTESLKSPFYCRLVL